MRSIRRRLFCWFLLGLGALWLAGGAAVFLSYRAGLHAGLEAELQTLLRQVRSTRAPAGGGPGWGGGRHAASPPPADDFGPGVYWQVWPLDGGAADRAPALLEDLPRFGPEHGASVVRAVEMANGTRVLALGARYGVGRAGEGAGGRWGQGGRGGAVEITVAKDLARTHRALARMLAGIGLAGLAVAGLAWLWVRFAVRDGLAPLYQIGERLAAIDAGSLGGRFEGHGAPEELRPIIARLNELMERLEAGFARERRFSSDLAHEMRTPIAELRLLAESALKWPEEGGPPAWYEARGAVERMESVVQAMLQLARLEQTTPRPPAAPFALRPLVDEAWAPHAARAAARRLTPRFDLTDSAEVAGDPALWAHLLANLLGNAAEYADEGGEVVVTIEPATPGAPPVVCVSNPASALAAEDAGRLFERFWRGDAARADGAHCGLGLPLARACAEAMGLRLEARMLERAGAPPTLELRVGPGVAAAG